MSEEIEEIEVEEIEEVDDDDQAGGDGKPFNYRQLEASRDAWKEEALAWRVPALRGIAEDAGFDPATGAGALILHEFERGLPDDLSPDEAASRFADFLEEHELTPESWGREGPRRVG